MKIHIYIYIFKLNIEENIINSTLEWQNLYKKYN